MKKLKIMLLSFALLTVVGGALAFKAKFLSLDCTTTFEAGDNCAIKTCPNATFSTTWPVGDLYCYTTDPDHVFDCKDENGNFLPCEELPTTLIPD
jgi:hypothetical protein